MKTINVHDTFTFDTESGDSGDGFVLVFQSAQYRIRIHFARWYLAVIVQELWNRVIKWRNEQARTENGIRADIQR